MEELNVALGNFATLALVVGGGVSVIAFAFAGFTFLTAQGDPVRLAQAKGGVIGVVAGLGVMGASFIIPNVVSETVIEPAGGVPIRVEHGVDCDRILKQQLVFQKHANNRERMQRVINEIQLKRDGCAEEFWNPLVILWWVHPDTTNHPSYATNENRGRSERVMSRCFGDAHNGWRPEHYQSPAIAAMAIGGNVVPASLRFNNDPRYPPRHESRRDADNNIIVYWARQSEYRPWDGAACWLYDSRLETWFGNYYATL